MSSSTNGLTTKLRSRLSTLNLSSKPGKLTPDQKLRCEIDNLTTRARDLNTTGVRLQREMDIFSTRVHSTPPPTPAPFRRESLFRKNSKAPPTQYETQITAHKALTTDWRRFEAEVGKWSRNLNRFEHAVEGLKRKGRKGVGMGRIEHDLEGLENAMFNLGALKGEVERRVRAINL